MAWAAAIGAGIQAVQNRQFRTADNRIAANRATEEYERQKEFAQMGIRWRVEDAKAAGLHPLAAIGAQTTSYSPVSVGAARYGGGDEFTQAGQAIERSINAKTTEAERDQNFRYTEARIKNLELQNRNLERDLNAPTQLPPSMPTEGVTPENPEPNVFNPTTIYQKQMGQSPGSAGTGSGQGIWEPEVQKIPTSEQMGLTAGPPQALETGYVDKDGEYHFVLSKNASEPYESDEFASTQRFIEKGLTWADGMRHWIWKNTAPAGSDAWHMVNDYEENLRHIRQIYLPALPEGLSWRYMPTKARFKVKKGASNEGIWWSEP